MNSTWELLNQSLLQLLEESEATLCRRYGIAPETYLRWRAHLQRLLDEDELAEENQRLYQILRERDTEISELKTLAGRFR